MNTDIRLSVGFWQHPKTKKLQKRAGLEAVRSLQILWLWVAVNRPSGDLSGMDGEDIELAADWGGEDGKLVETLAEVGFLDECDGLFAIHDWDDHNGWAASDGDRSDTGRFNILKKKYPDVHAKLAAAGVVRISKRDYEALREAGTRQAVVERLLMQAGSNAEPEPEQEQDGLKPASSTAEAPLQGGFKGASSTGQSVLEGASSNLEVLPTCPSPSPIPSPIDKKTPPLPPAGGRGGRLHPAPMSGEEIEDARDAVHAGRRKGDYEFSLLRQEYDNALPEGAETGRAEFLRLYASHDYPGIDELLESVRRMAAEDDQWRRGYAPSLSRYLREKMWTMRPRKPRAEAGADPEPTDEQKAVNERIAKMREEMKAKQAAKKKQRGGW